MRYSTIIGTVILFLGITGCLTRPQVKQEEPLTCPQCPPCPEPQKTVEASAFQEAISENQKSKDIAREIARLEATITKNGDKASQKQSHLRLALLYIDAKNPNPNYSGSLNQLQKYASLDPEGGKKIEIQTLIRILKELLDEREEGKRARDRGDKLSEENKELRTTVEKLKKLDISIEEKRRQLK